MKQLFVKILNILFVATTTIEILVYGAFIAGSIFGSFAHTPGLFLGGKCLNIFCEMRFWTLELNILIIFIIVPVKIILSIINFYKKNLLATSLFALYISLFNPFASSVIGGIIDFSSIVEKIAVNIHYYVTGGKSFSAIFFIIGSIAFYVSLFKEGKEGKEGNKIIN